MFRNNLTISNNGNHTTPIAKRIFLSLLVVSSAIPFFLMVPELNPAFAQPTTIEYGFVTDFEPNEQFGNPDITIDETTGNIFVADYFNNRVIKFDSSGNIITQWGTAGTGNGEFHNPQDVEVDSSGNLYVTDTHNHRIQKFDNNGQFIKEWGTSGSGPGQLLFPSRLAFDSNDILYVTEPDNGRIQKFDTDGGFVGTIAEGQLSFPVGIDLDSADNVYVAESGLSGNPSQVDKFSSSGQLITSWGSLGSDDGQFNQPKGLHVDSQNNVIVADEFNDRVQIFDENGNFITKFDGMLGHPIDVASDSMGRIYVSDENNGQILIYGLVVVDPATAIEELIMDVRNLDGVPNGVRQSLIAQLNVALRFISDDNTANDHISCTKLDTFTTKVSDFENKGLLTAGQADVLRQQGRVILDSDAIGCGLSQASAATEIASSTNTDNIQSSLAISLPH